MTTTNASPYQIFKRFRLSSRNYPDFIKKLIYTQLITQLSRRTQHASIVELVEGVGGVATFKIVDKVSKLLSVT